MFDYIDRFSYIEPSMHPWDKAYLIMLNDVFHIFLDLACKYFIEYFCVNVHKKNGVKFSFSIEVLCGLGIWVTGLIE
jgi:hypothetical protein